MLPVNSNSYPVVTAYNNPLFASSSSQNTPNMALNQPPKVHPFVPFNKGSPLNLVQHDDIPTATLKSWPFFIGEDQTIAIEHIRDVASLCGVHHIVGENVTLRLLAASFKGKALQ